MSLFQFHLYILNQWLDIYMYTWRVLPPTHYPPHTTPHTAPHTLPPHYRCKEWYRRCSTQSTEFPFVPTLDDSSPPYPAPSLVSTLVARSYPHPSLLRCWHCDLAHEESLYQNQRWVKYRPIYHTPTHTPTHPHTHTHHTHTHPHTHTHTPQLRRSTLATCWADMASSSV